MNDDPSPNPLPEEKLVTLLKVRSEPLFREVEAASPWMQYPWQFVQNLSKIFEYALPYLEREYEEVLEDVWIARGVRIHGSAVLKGPLVLGQGTVIGEKVHLTGPVYLGDSVCLDPGVRVESSIICEEVFIGSGCRVVDSIIGMGAVLGRNVHTNTDPEGYERKTQAGCDRLGSCIGPWVRVPDWARLIPGTILLNS